MRQKEKESRAISQCHSAAIVPARDCKQTRDHNNSPTQDNHQQHNCGRAWTKLAQQTGETRATVTQVCCHHHTREATNAQSANWRNSKTINPSEIQPLGERNREAPKGRQQVWSEEAAASCERASAGARGDEEREAKSSKSRDLMVEKRRQEEQEEKEEQEEEEEEAQAKERPKNAVEQQEERADIVGGGGCDANEQRHDDELAEKKEEELADGDESSGESQLESESASESECECGSGSGSGVTRADSESTGEGGELSGDAQVSRPNKEARRSPSPPRRRHLPQYLFNGTTFYYQPPAQNLLPQTGHTAAGGGVVQHQHQHQQQPLAYCAPYQLLVAPPFAPLHPASEQANHIVAPPPAHYVLFATTPAPHPHFCYHHHHHHQPLCSPPSSNVPLEPSPPTGTPPRSQALSYFQIPQQAQAQPQPRQQQPQPQPQPQQHQHQHCSSYATATSTNPFVHAPLHASTTAPAAAAAGAPTHLANSCGGPVPFWLAAAPPLPLAPTHAVPLATQTPLVQPVPLAPMQQPVQLYDYPPACANLHVHHQAPANNLLYSFNPNHLNYDPANLLSPHELVPSHLSYHQQLPPAPAAQLNRQVSAAMPLAGLPPEACPLSQQAHHQPAATVAPNFGYDQLKLGYNLLPLLPIDAQPTRIRQAYGMDKVWQEEFELLFSQFVSSIVWTLVEVETNPSIRKSCERIIGYKGRFIVKVDGDGSGTSEQRQRAESARPPSCSATGSWTSGQGSSLRSSNSTVSSQETGSLNEPTSRPTSLASGACADEQEAESSSEELSTNCCQTSDADSLDCQANTSASMHSSILSQEDHHHHHQDEEDKQSVVDANEQGRCLLNEEQKPISGGTPKPEVVAENPNEPMVENSDSSELIEEQQQANVCGKTINKEAQVDGGGCSSGTNKPVSMRFKMFIDSAKVRFCCDNCGHGWTSMKGRVVFWYELFELIDESLLSGHLVEDVRQRLSAGGGKGKGGAGSAIGAENGSNLIGYCAYKLFGQQCDICKIENRFERPMWYPEEVTKVLNNLCNKIGQVYFGFRMPTIDRQRRAGKPKTSHNSSLCQACHDGVCTDRK